MLQRLMLFGAFILGFILAQVCFRDESLSNALLNLGEVARGFILGAILSVIVAFILGLILGRLIPYLRHLRNRSKS